ncbi:peptidase inhibitor family I36 protein [Streptomyces sp. 7R007]
MPITKTLTAGAAALIAATALVLCGTPAQADDAHAVDTHLPAELDALMRANPGAKQLDDRTIELRNGVIARLTPVSESSPAAWPPSCDYGWLCLFSGIQGGGDRLNLYRCGFVNIGSQYGWSDKLRSYVNNQTPGTRSSFYNWTGSQWEWLGDSVAKDQSPNVPTRLWYTDAITVC